MRPCLVGLRLHGLLQIPFFATYEYESYVKIKDSTTICVGVVEFLNFWGRGVVMRLLS